MIQGHHLGLLDELHATGCDGKEYSTCEVVPNMQLYYEHDPDETPFFVLYLEWCGECGAADFDFVGR